MARYECLDRHRIVVMLCKPGAESYLRAAGHLRLSPPWGRRHDASPASPWSAFYSDCPAPSPFTAPPPAHRPHARGPAETGPSHFIHRAGGIPTAETWPEDTSSQASRLARLSVGNASKNSVSGPRPSTRPDHDQRPHPRHAGVPRHALGRRACQRCGCWPTAATSCQRGRGRTRSPLEARGHRRALATDWRSPHDTLRCNRHHPGELPAPAADPHAEPDHQLRMRARTHTREPDLDGVG